MSDNKSKTSKSKSRNTTQQKKDFVKPYIGAASVDQNNNTSKTQNGTQQLFQKLDLEHLKEASLGGKSSLGPSARELYIDYALDMVINNLVLNGHLDQTKVSQMRTPVMKSQIASLCDKMLAQKSSKSATGKIETNKSISLTRSKQKPQKWALQPASLPITIITDQVPPHAYEGLMDQNESGSFRKPNVSKSNANANDDTSKKKRPSKYKKAKSSNSNITSLNAGTDTRPSLLRLLNGISINETYGMPPTEVPSSLSMEHYETLDPSISSSGGLDWKQYRNVHFEGVDLFKSDEIDTKGVDGEQGRPLSNGTVLTPIFQPPPSGNRNRSAGLASCPSSTKTLNALVRSTSSITISRGYQILVNMKGFHNEEISMEVEGRQLIFLASRPKRDGLNLRRVTEIVDVPQFVVMENLKIGRRVDGYVIVEEHDSEIDQ